MGSKKGKRKHEREMLSRTLVESKGRFCPFAVVPVVCSYFDVPLGVRVRSVCENCKVHSDWWREMDEAELRENEWWEAVSKNPDAWLRGEL